MACGCGCPLVGGSFCAVSQKCTRTILGSDMGPGCFFLVLRGERAAGERVFLVYCYSEAPKQLGSTLATCSV